MSQEKRIICKVSAINAILLACAVLTAGQILQRSRSRRANVQGMSFTIGAGRRRVMLGKDGLPKVSRLPRQRQGSREQGLKKSGMGALPVVSIRRR